MQKKSQLLQKLKFLRLMLSMYRDIILNIFFRVHFTKSEDQMLILISFDIHFWHLKNDSVQNFGRKLSLPKLWLGPGNPFWDRRQIFQAIFSSKSGRGKLLANYVLVWFYFKLSDLNTPNYCARSVWLSRARYTRPKSRFGIESVNFFCRFVKTHNLFLAK